MSAVADTGNNLLRYYQSNYGCGSYDVDYFLISKKAVRPIIALIKHKLVVTRLKLQTQFA